MTIKCIEFHGTSLNDIKKFPDGIRQDAGYQLHRVQLGENPSHWDSFPEIAPGVKEIKLKEGNDIFRVIYVTKFKNAIHVLHAFQKKDQVTRESDKKIARKRYKKLVNRR